MKSKELRFYLSCFIITYVIDRVILYLLRLNQISLVENSLLLDFILWMIIAGIVIFLRGKFMSFNEVDQSQVK